MAAATSGSAPPPLRVRGSDVDAHFGELLDAAGRRGDYTDLLTKDRGFGLTDGVAYGEGVEREVMMTIFKGFTASEAQWVTHPDTGASSRALPSVMSPALFQYLIHDGNFHSLNPSFIGEWFPALRALILAWLALDPEDQDLTFRFRDLLTHRAFPITMLFRATIATATFDHPEMRSFRDGFFLPCRNGFNLPSAIRNFQGGSETFLSLVATSHISSADSVLPHLEAINPANLDTHINALRGYISDITLTFDIPLHYRAPTGTPFLSPTGANVLLRPINTHGDGYGAPGDNAVARDRLAGAGTFHLATCFRTIRYPVEYVLRLAQVHYSPESEPANFQEAFDFWFLYQCLIAIGRHNIL
ncbi:hypothetical protein B0H13DRAFT_2373352 [Mycena leptocephala]|nr:hypothetical protein B0H13DRAFT_2373352 [Mycena leptocephala]